MNSAIPPQMTVKAVVLAVILAVVLAAANAYLGLFAGMTVAASIPAAVVSMAVLRLFAESNILENNIVQTGASAGVSIASGVIFTIPALVMLGHWQTFQYSWVLAIAGLGGLLGVLFSVPLRRTLIVEQKLAFPEGQATAEVLRVGDDPSAGVKALGLAAIAGGLVKLAETGLRLFAETFQAATYVGKGTIAYFGSNLSPALLGVGYIIGLNVAMLVFIGGVISWWIAIPIYSTFFLDGDPGLAAQVAGLSAADAAYTIWGAKIRYVGVGAMLIGGIWALISLRHSLVSGVRSGLASRGSTGVDLPHTERDIPMNYILIGIVAFVLPIFILYQTVVESVGISLPMTIIMIVAGFLFSSVSGYMAGLVGSSNNPVSGITIATILFASLVLLVLGTPSDVGPVAAIMIGAVICSSAAIAGDNLQDLKCGYLVGATPWRQEVMLGVGAVASAAVMAPVLNLLLKAYGIGVPTPEHPNALLAPQATLMASVARGMFGDGLPWGLVGIGGGIGAVIIALDEYLKRLGTKWRTPVLAVAVGIYLPLELATPILIGGLIAQFADRFHARRHPGEDPERLKRQGMLFAAGLITGEALIGILMAIPIVVTGDRNVLALPSALQFGGWLGMIIVLWLGYVLYRRATPSGGAAGV